uniref:Gem-associated protein 2 n=1 Tax=Ciona savignyi TaxID=51511 RepID=H2ZGR5_CIOSA
MSLINTTDCPTGEKLSTGDELTYDYAPGNSPFFKLDREDMATYVPTNGLPSNPQDYLRSVWQEAQRCPDVVVANINREKIKSTKATSFVHHKLPGSEHAPTKEWCDHQMIRFSHAREDISRHIARLKSIKRQSKKRPKLPIYPLPHFEDEENWRYFCLGNKQTKIKNLTNDTDMKSDTDINENVDESMDDEIVEEPASPMVPDEEDNIVDLSTLQEGYPPLMRIVLRMEPKHIESNLEFHVNWLKEYEFSKQQGRWIYALLTLLEKPLYPTVISTLRDLSRECSKLRNQQSNCQENLNGLNLIICIVGRYFSQSDLLDPE